MVAAEKVEEKQEPKPKKMNRRVSAALNHVLKRRTVLLEKRAELTAEIEKLDGAILSLE